MNSTPTPPRTTHAAWGAGSPRLIVSEGDTRTTVALTADLVSIGSGPDCDIRVADADPMHATIRHDDRDEFVLRMHGEGETHARADAAATHPDGDALTLRTGAQFTAGSARCVFQREEYADHGRPDGGRQGGELSDQTPQPVRPDYSEGARTAEGDVPAPGSRADAPLEAQD